MTITAVVRHITMVEAGVTPVSGGVAVIALIIGLHVIGSLAVCPYIVVAALALLRCTDKETVEMATVALQIAMSA